MKEPDSLNEFIEFYEQYKSSTSRRKPKAQQIGKYALKNWFYFNVSNKKVIDQQFISSDENFLQVIQIVAFLSFESDHLPKLKTIIQCGYNYWQAQYIQTNWDNICRMSDQRTSVWPILTQHLRKGIVKDIYQQFQIHPTDPQTYLSTVQKVTFFFDQYEKRRKQNDRFDIVIQQSQSYRKKHGYYQKAPLSSMSDAVDAFTVYMALFRQKLTYNLYILQLYRKNWNQYTQDQIISALRMKPLACSPLWKWSNYLGLFVYPASYGELIFQHNSFNPMDLINRCGTFTYRQQLSLQKYIKIVPFRIDGFMQMMAHFNSVLWAKIYNMPDSSQEKTRFGQFQRSIRKIAQFIITRNIFYIGLYQLLNLKMAIGRLKMNKGKQFPQGSTWSPLITSSCYDRTHRLAILVPQLQKQYITKQLISAQFRQAQGQFSATHRSGLIVLKDLAQPHSDKNPMYPSALFLQHILRGMQWAVAVFADKLDWQTFTYISNKMKLVFQRQSNREQLAALELALSSQKGIIEQLRQANKLTPQIKQWWSEVQDEIENRTLTISYPWTSRTVKQDFPDWNWDDSSLTLIGKPTTNQFDVWQRQKNTTYTVFPTIQYWQRAIASVQQTKGIHHYWDQNTRKWNVKNVESITFSINGKLLQSLRIPGMFAVTSGDATPLYERMVPQTQQAFMGQQWSNFNVEPLTPIQSQQQTNIPFFQPLQQQQTNIQFFQPLPQQQLQPPPFIPPPPPSLIQLASSSNSQIPQNISTSIPQQPLNMSFFQQPVLQQTTEFQPILQPPPPPLIEMANNSQPNSTSPPQQVTAAKPFQTPNPFAKPTTNPFNMKPPTTPSSFQDIFAKYKMNNQTKQVVPQTQDLLQNSNTTTLKPPSEVTSQPKSIIQMATQSKSVKPSGFAPPRNINEPVFKSFQPTVDLLGQLQQQPPPPMRTQNLVLSFSQPNIAQILKTPNIANPIPRFLLQQTPTPQPTFPITLNQSLPTIQQPLQTLSPQPEKTTQLLPQKKIDEFSFAKSIFTPPKPPSIIQQARQQPPVTVNEPTAIIQSPQKNGQYIDVMDYFLEEQQNPNEKPAAGASNEPVQAPEEVQAEESNVISQVQESQPKHVLEFFLQRTQKQVYPELETMRYMPNDYAAPAQSTSQINEMNSRTPPWLRRFVSTNKQTAVFPLQTAPQIQQQSTSNIKTLKDLMTTTTITQQFAQSARGGVNNQIASAFRQQNRQAQYNNLRRFENLIDIEDSPAQQQQPAQAQPQQRAQPQQAQRQATTSIQDANHPVGKFMQLYNSATYTPYEIKKDPNADKTGLSIAAYVKNFADQKIGQTPSSILLAQAGNPNSLAWKGVPGASFLNGAWTHRDLDRHLNNYSTDRQIPSHFPSELTQQYGTKMLTPLLQFTNAKLKSLGYSGMGKVAKQGLPLYLGRWLDKKNKIKYFTRPKVTYNTKDWTQAFTKAMFDTVHQWNKYISSQQHMLNVIKDKDNWDSKVEQIQRNQTISQMKRRKMKSVLTSIQTGRNLLFNYATQPQKVAITSAINSWNYERLKEVLSNLAVRVAGERSTQIIVNNQVGLLRALNMNKNIDNGIARVVASTAAKNLLTQPQDSTSFKQSARGYLANPQLQKVISEQQVAPFSKPSRIRKGGGYFYTQEQLLDAYQRAQANPDKMAPIKAGGGKKKKEFTQYSLL